MWIKDLFLSNLFFLTLSCIVLLYISEYLMLIPAGTAGVCLAVFAILSVADMGILFRNRNGLYAERHLAGRLSNGDENEVRIRVVNRYIFNISGEVIDELPGQLQVRDFSLSINLKPGAEVERGYTVRPTERGEYHFGRLLVYVRSLLGLVKRRYAFDEGHTVPVYPSFIQIRKFELMAFSNRPADTGLKRIPRVGHTMEFDRIKEYVRGDDVRAINWKATARVNTLMVNTYQEERSQQVISIIDTGRAMKPSFGGMHLMDYAINTSLVISNIVLLKEDRAGLITLSANGTTFLKPQKKREHIRKLQEQLYNLETNFLESDYRQLLLLLGRNVQKRSLLLFYTNFETLTAMKRRLPWLRKIAKKHLLVVLFFDNVELQSVLDQSPDTVEEIYTKTVAEQFNFEKRQIVKILNHYGIQTVLTPPNELSVHTINKYLELKARGLL